MIKLDTCFNGQMDGDETDKDCGGQCQGCGPMQDCKIDNDCASTVPCVNKLCGLDGKTKESAGYTCKQILIHFKDSKNGFYYVTGPNNENNGPRKVMCWMEDRDGGGWTLAVKHWYGQHHHFAGNGRRQTNNINIGVLAHLGQYYKMDDKEIRAYMGQPDPNDDDVNAKASEINIMRDQNGHNTHHGNANREYTVLKKYTARWYWETASKSIYPLRLQPRICSRTPQSGVLSWAAVWAAPCFY